MKNGQTGEKATLDLQGDSMLRFGQVPAARDEESHGNFVTPHVPVGAGVASVVRHGFRRTERSNPLHIGDCFASYLATAKGAPRNDACGVVALSAT